MADPGGISVFTSSGGLRALSELKHIYHSGMAPRVCLSVCLSVSTPVCTHIIRNAVLPPGFSCTPVKWKGNIK